MAGLDASEVAKLLVEYGQRLELGGDNPYKARAYYKAAESLSGLTVPLTDVIAQGRLRDIPGVGAALAAKILKLQGGGIDPTLQAMRQDVPVSVLEMLRIPGIKPHQVLQIYKGLNISSLDELEEACGKNLLKNRKGLGPALQEKILQGLEMLRSSHRSRLIHRASEFMDGVVASLTRSHPELSRVVVAGDVRRGCELAQHLSIAAEAPRVPADQRSVQLNEEITLHLAEPARYGVALLLATGSASHVEQLQVFAAERGLKLDESGLRHGRRRIACADETDVYAALGLPIIAPELREGQDEIELAQGGGLPALVRDRDIRGLLHCHTDQSDGVDSLEVMAEATRERGYAYFGVADHSRSAGYAGGLTVEEIEAQHALIDEINGRYAGKFRIFKGIESDILPDGSLDYPDEVLETFDFVVASVHSRFRLDRKTQTERILRAVANPHTTILGHMTGRMLLRRPGYEVDIAEILAACAAHGVAVEINANPRRLDLDWRWHRRALELGCMMSINPDAHSTGELDLTHWGVAMARKGGVPKERILNCHSLSAITRHFDKRTRSRLRKNGSGGAALRKVT
jgi:DNA polymerase (family 10)